MMKKYAFSPGDLVHIRPGSLISVPTAERYNYSLVLEISKGYWNLDDGWEISHTDFYQLLQPSGDRTSVACYLFDRVAEKAAPSSEKMVSK